LQALRDGRIEAEFRGAGGSAVDVTIRRTLYGPTHVTISPGTYFAPTARRVQPQTTLGWVPINLGRNGVARVQLKTACMDINLPAAGYQDVLYARPCQDERMFKLCSAVNPTRDDHGAIQLAVWAIANNPPQRQMRGHSDMAKTKLLLRRAGLDPNSFRMFKRHVSPMLHTL